MERIDRVQRSKYTISKALQKFSLGKLPQKLLNIKPKNQETYLMNINLNPSKFPKSTTNSMFKKISSHSRIPNLDPIPSENMRKIKQISIRNKRNLSVEGNYEEEDREENKTLKRNSSLIEMYAKSEEWDVNKLPYSPAIVLKNFSRYLTTFEQSEVLNYRNIYYIAAGINKLEPKLKEINNGFDDERNDYVLVKNDHICYRYEILEIIGRGSYGQVIKAFDHKEKKFMALKIIRNLACIIQQAKIEIQVLYKLIQQEIANEYLIKIVDNSVFRNHIIQTFDLLDINLYQYLKQRSFNPIPTGDIKTYTQQMLEGMKFYHNLQILHCDLKPENIMVSQDRSKIKIIDFGSACFANRRIFTYIQSRYYRAPEVILEIGYDYKIDIWSLGCILAEMWIGKPIFAGKDEIDQLFSIMEVLGVPPNYLLDQSIKREIICEGIKKASIANLNNTKLRIPGSRGLKQLINTNDSSFLDFLAKCFAWNPHDRFSASEALEHEWFKNGLLHKNQSLPELKVEKNSSAMNTQKKLHFDQPLTHRIIRKKTLASSLIQV